MAAANAAATSPGPVLDSCCGCLEVEELLDDWFDFDCELADDLLVELLGAEFLLDPEVEGCDCCCD